MATVRDEVGARRRRLILEAPVTGSGDAGSLTESFVPVAAVWASLRWTGGDERWQADRMEQAGRHEITLRWRPMVSAGMRFRDGQRLFGVLSAGDPDGGRRRLVCLCEELSP